MASVAQFLTARLNEDEAALRVEQIEVPPSRNPDGSWMTVPGQWKPGDARALAEVAAKRRIIDDYMQSHANQWSHPGDLATKGALLAHFAAVIHLASVYSDHPDYQQEWKS